MPIFSSVRYLRSLMTKRTTMKKTIMAHRMPMQIPVTKPFLSGFLLIVSYISYEEEYEAYLRIKETVWIPSLRGVREIGQAEVCRKHHNQGGKVDPRMWSGAWNHNFEKGKDRVQRVLRYVAPGLVRRDGCAGREGGPEDS